MKKIFVLLLFISLLYTASTAQQTVSWGSSHDYSVDDNGLTYTWTCSGGTDTDFDNQHNANISVVWNTPGEYVLSVFATDINLCISETKNINVKVLDQSSITFDFASADIATCSDLNSGASGGLSDLNEFELNIIGGLPPYKLKYKILKPNGDEFCPELEVDIIKSRGAKISIPNDFNNTTKADITYKVIITEFITKDGVSVNLSTNVTENSRSITIYAKPVISTIKIN